MKGMTKNNTKQSCGKIKRRCDDQKKDKLVERWTEYVEELYYYYDERLDKPDIATTRTEVKISEAEVSEIIRKLPKIKQQEQMELQRN